MQGYNSFERWLVNKIQIRPIPMNPDELYELFHAFEFEFYQLITI